MKKENNVKFYDICKSVAGVDFEGKVAVNGSTGDVDLLGLCEDAGLMLRKDGIDLMSAQTYLKALAIRKASRDFPGLLNNYCISQVCGVSCFISDCVPYYDGGYILKTAAREYEGKYYYINNFRNVTIKNNEDDTYAAEMPYDVLNRKYLYCDVCGCYTLIDNWDTNRNCCKFCGKYKVIESYGISHEHNVHPIYYIDVLKGNCVLPSTHVEDFAGLGFELEVQNLTNSNVNHNKIAYDLCSAAGLDSKELRYAWDASVSRGFEIISQPHTVKAFWNRQKQWESMLDYLRLNQYVSHKTGECGLHVHISRLFFGREEKQQDEAISKIYAFFETNWDNIVLVSRRHDFGYCDRNNRRNTYDKHGMRESAYKSWKKQSKWNGSHGCALNNSNSNTFEIRLGRGSLNPAAFFAWIDFVITIAKNAKRITVNKVESNDVISWLAGIRESTANYIYKRGAFKNAIEELFPSIGWAASNYDAD